MTLGTKAVSDDILAPRGQSGSRLQRGVDFNWTLCRRKPDNWSTKPIAAKKRYRPNKQLL
jgi:hypothetical protein